MNDSSSEEADNEFAAVRRKARERDDFTCQFCGFRHPKPDRIGGRDSHYYMQIHHLDDDHHNNTPQNLVCACMHCHAVQHIGLWGSANEAVIVYLPEMSQMLLNHFCRVVLVAKRFQAKAESDLRTQQERARGGPPDQHITQRLISARNMAEATQAIFDRIRAREAEAQMRLGTSDASDLGTALLHLPEEEYRKRHKAFAPFRLLLLGHHYPGGRQASQTDAMQEIVDGWITSGPFSGLDPSGWARLLQPSGR